MAQALVERGLDAGAIHFVGGQRGNEGTLVPEAGFSIDLLPGRGIQRRLTPANVGAVVGLLAGLAKGFWMVVRRRPKAVLCLGGYAAFAVSAAAVLLRVPVVVSEQNARASAVNRLFGRFARVCALRFPTPICPTACSPATRPGPPCSTRWPEPIGPPPGPRWASATAWSSATGR